MKKMSDRPKHGEITVGDSLMVAGSSHKVVKVYRGKLVDKYKFEDGNKIRGGDRWYDAWECRKIQYGN